MDLSNDLFLGSRAYILSINHLSTDPSIYRSIYLYIYIFTVTKFNNFLFTVFRSLLLNKEFIWMASKVYEKYHG